VTSLHHLAPSIASGSVKATLDALYADTMRTDPAVRETAREQGFADEGANGFYSAMRAAYMPVTPDMGTLLYLLARCIGARTIVEFGTSFGISTIFLAAAVRDNGGGRVITTEFEAAKAERARQHLARAGLETHVEIRIGDACKTLSGNVPNDIDFVLLDGAKEAYLPVLKILEPRLRKGALVSADNTDMPGASRFLQYVGEQQSGYVAARIFTYALGSHHGNQILMRV
jgi:predicted O-methyltransferase YrrM